MRRWHFLFIIFLMVVLHQDNWLWTSKHLVFGFIPAGLAYHMGYSLLAMTCMAFLVKFAWPARLDAQEAEIERWKSAASRSGTDGS